MVAISHTVCWQAASSRRRLAASKVAGRSGRGHHDRLLDQALALVVSSPENSCPSQPSCLLPCCSRSPLVVCQPRWMPFAGTLFPPFLVFPIFPLRERSLSLKASVLLDPKPTRRPSSLHSGS